MEKTGEEDLDPNFLSLKEKSEIIIGNEDGREENCRLEEKKYGNRIQDLLGFDEIDPIGWSTKAEQAVVGIIISHLATSDCLKFRGFQKIKKEIPYSSWKFLIEELNRKYIGWKAISSVISLRVVVTSIARGSKSSCTKLILWV